MTKNQEIQILRDAVAKLSLDSYCGPWLAQQIEIVESAIKSDFFPTVDLRETARDCANMARQCRVDCDGAIARAKKEADQVVASARKDADRISGRVLCALRQSVKEMEAVQ